MRMTLERYSVFFSVVAMVAMGALSCGSGDPHGTADPGTVVTDTWTDPGATWDGPVLGTGDWVATPDLKPHSIHVTWLGDTGQSATVQWQTQMTSPADYVPLVWFAREDEVQMGKDDAMGLPFDDSHVAEGAGFTYLTFTDEVSNLEVIHWAVDVHGLVPDTVYYYRAGTWGGFNPWTGEFEEPNLTPVHRFKTGSTKGVRTPMRFVAAGDSRSDGGKLAESSPRFAEIEADFWLFTGDMTEVGTQEEWWYWFESMEPVLTTRVFMPVQGNHEFLSEYYYSQWSLPGMAGLPQEYKEHGWSFDYGNLHVVGLDSNYESVVKGQLPWLESDLAQADADPDIDWKVVIFHQAAYSASSHGSTKYVQEHLVPVFEEHGVDLVINGHDHNYERTHPILEDAVVDPGEGVVYVVAGSFFAPPYGNGNEWWTAVSEHGDKGNYLTVEINDNVLTGTAFSIDGKETLDTFTLTHD